jgi:NAD(P)H-flavin reductase
MTAKKMLGKVIFKACLAGSNWLVRVGFDETVDYVPGQYVSLKVSEDGMRRSYSITSLPGEKSIDLLIDVSPMGVGSQYVLGLSVGDLVEVLGFLGKFGVKEEMRKKESELLFVGTGAGIAPLKPMIEDLLTKKFFRGKVYLVWGMRHEEDLYWIKEIEKLQRDFENFHFYIVISKPGEDWPGLNGHVGDVVEKLNINWDEAFVYLCGNSEMIASMEKQSLLSGAIKDRIFYEGFA